MVKQQWFVKMEEMAKPAIEALKTGELKFVPESFGKTYLHWLEGIRDWCISRQLWWGHRIPAYYCQDCGEIVVAKTAPDTCPKCGRHEGGEEVKFERIRRITGYLVGTLDRFNNAKRAEEHDRVKHKLS